MTNRIIICLFIMSLLLLCFYIRFRKIHPIALKNLLIKHHKLIIIASIFIFYLFLNILGGYNGISFADTKKIIENVMENTDQDFTESIENENVVGQKDVDAKIAYWDEEVNILGCKISRRDIVVTATISFILILIIFWNSDTIGDISDANINEEENVWINDFAEINFNNNGNETNLLELVSDKLTDDTTKDITNEFIKNYVNRQSINYNLNNEIQSYLEKVKR